MGVLVPFDREPVPDEWPGTEPLWREVTGPTLRASRHFRKQTLAEVAARAGVSVQYLSEVERGLKDPSSEVLAAIAGALDLTLVELLVAVSRRVHTLRDATSRPLPVGRPTGPLALAA